MGRRRRVNQNAEDNRAISTADGLILCGGHGNRAFDELLPAGQLLLVAELVLFDDAGAGNYGLLFVLN